MKSIYRFTSIYFVRLIEEQQQFQTNSSSLANEQVSLNKELKQCNIVLEVQKVGLLKQK